MKVKFVLLLLLGWSSLQAQECYWAAQVGMSNYYGDLARSESVFAGGNPRYALGLKLGTDFRNSMNLDFQYSFAQIQANDFIAENDGQSERGLEFTSDIHDFTITAGYYLLRHRFHNGSSFKFLISSGVSLFYMDPQTRDGVSIQGYQFESDTNMRRCNMGRPPEGVRNERMIDY